MKIDLLSSNQDLCIKIEGKISKDEELWFRSILDHAWLKKVAVTYNQTDKTLVIRLKRHDLKKSKAKKKILGFTIWNNNISPTIQCLLTIRDVEHCDIRDEDPKTPQKQEVIIGGVAFDNDNNEIYIGSFCEHDNAYGITLKVKRINLTFEDI